MSFCSTNRPQVTGSPGFPAKRFTYTLMLSEGAIAAGWPEDWDKIAKIWKLEPKQ
jgi:hypothetical protein